MFIQLLPIGFHFKICHKLRKKFGANSHKYGQIQSLFSFHFGKIVCCT